MSILQLRTTSKLPEHAVKTRFYQEISAFYQLPVNYIIQQSWSCVTRRSSFEILGITTPGSSHRNHQWRFGFRVVDDPAGHTEHAFDQFCRHNVARCPLGHNLAILHEHKVRRVAECQMKVMQYRNNRHTVPMEALRQAQDLQLVIEVKIRRWLIKEQNVRRLGK